MDSVDGEPQAASQDSWVPGVDSATHDDPLLSCLVLISRLEQRPQSAAAFAAGLPLEDGRLTPPLFVRAAERAGLSARIVKRPLGDISRLVLPAVLLLKNQQACVLTGLGTDGEAEVIFPESGEATAQVAPDDLAALYSGYAIFVRPAHRFDSRSEDSLIPERKNWFWGTLGLSWRIYGEVMVASLLVNLFALASPLFVMNVYDRVVPNQAIETLWVLAVGVLIVFLFDFLLKTLRAYFLDVAGKKFDVILSARLYERVMGLQLAARPQSVGAFASNLREFDSCRDFFTSATLVSLIDLPFMVLFLLVIWLLGGPMVLVPLAVVPVVVIYALVIQRPLKAVVQRLFRHGAEKNAMLIETLSGLETIKSMGAESPVQRRWEQAVGQIATLGMRSRFLSASVVNVAAFFAQMATVGVVVFGVYRIGEGLLSLGGLIACSILTGRALAPLAQVANLLTRYDQSVAALRSVENIMNLPVERPEGSRFVSRPALKGGIEFKNVSFSYPNQPVAALSDVSFKINPGERVAVIGRIGSGKSTLEKLLLGLYQPAEGAVLLDGTDARQLDPADLRRNIGYVPQDIALFFGSVRDNIVYGAPHVDDAAMLRAAEIAGVNAFVDSHPAGYDLPVGERGEGLSGGQRQTVAIARSLVLDPPILVMDEPSNAMDNSTEEQFKTRLAEHMEGKTLLLVTHRASLLTLVDRLIVMDASRIVADGPKAQVLEALSKGRLRTARQ
ncbi:MAG: type I secretion system permease/ATPase [Gammaproteobacteria bacterium]|nr:type I secretion system permease/ATPase [Gammaproteobacteria bacterium]